MSRMVYDVKLMRPACVLLQAVWGGDASLLKRHFDSSTWLVSPTPDMRMIDGTEEEWARVASLTQKKKGRKHRSNRSNHVAQQF